MILMPTDYKLVKIRIRCLKSIRFVTTKCFQEHRTEQKMCLVVDLKNNSSVMTALKLALIN